MCYFVRSVFTLLFFLAFKGGNVMAKQYDDPYDCMRSFMMHSLRWLNKIRYIAVTLYCSYCGCKESYRLYLTNKERKRIKDRLIYAEWQARNARQYIYHAPDRCEAQIHAEYLSRKRLEFELQEDPYAYFIEKLENILCDYIEIKTSLYIDEWHIDTLEDNCITFSGKYVCDLCLAYNEAHDLNAILNESWRYCPQDTLLDNMVWSHGVATGFVKSDKSWDDYIENFKKICMNNTMELCCSDKSQRIGAWGVYLSGQIKVASIHDLWSGRLCKSSKQRIWNTSDTEEYLVYDKINYMKGLNKYDHTEVILYHYRIRGIWIKQWYWKKLTKEEKEKMNYLRETCVKNNMVFHIVDRRHK